MNTQDVCHAKQKASLDNQRKNGLTVEQSWLSTTQGENCEQSHCRTARAGERGEAQEAGVWQEKSASQTRRGVLCTVPWQE
jgi:hypothetical protein